MLMDYNSPSQCDEASETIIKINYEQRRDSGAVTCRRNARRQKPRCS